jgi:polysaccharide export outer membrane protein
MTFHIVPVDLSRGQSRPGGSTGLMRIIASTSMSLLAAFLLVLATGCAYAPGVRFGDAAADTGRRDSSSAEADGTADAAPAGALQSITPDLIRAQRAARPTAVDAQVKRLFGVAQPYQIGPGDILNIVVWDHPELVLAPAGSITTDASGSTVSNGYDVSPMGLIQFPYIGNLVVGGLTEYELHERLTTRLARYFTDPKVTVRIQAYRSGRVYVDGAVRTPGLQLINDIPMTLPEAINRAGGLAPDADRSTVSVSRDGRPVNINLQQLTALGINPNNILLSNGDLVRVASRDDAKVYVMGEVSHPMAQPLRDGRLTLNEALGEAGGVNTTSGDPRQIYVVRAKVDGSAPEIYHLDAHSAAAYALAEGFALQARDVVYVDPAPLVRWNRVVSLILPSALAVTAGKALVW